jgi:hypothetical protein
VPFPTRTDGDVIITITLFGEVDVELVHDPDSRRLSELLPVERVRNIKEGDAYGIWSKARWKMKHDAILRAHRARTAPAPLRCT